MLFNSGYDANLGLFSCVPQRGDTIIYDELIHASIHGRWPPVVARRIILCSGTTILAHLEQRLKTAKGNVFVAVESVYSMDGDFAPLIEMVALCRQHHAHLIVDEAHATGIFGEQGQGRAVELGIENELFARVHTFGKALGCHGAVVIGSTALRDYLVNYARSFIYTTALPMHSLITIRAAYEYLQQEDWVNSIAKKITFFKDKINEEVRRQLVSSNRSHSMYYYTGC